jgi:alpha-beta hydrolase superfamily lysophospholipase
VQFFSTIFTHGTHMTESTTLAPAETAGVCPSEHRVSLDDGTELFYRAWLPAEPTDKSLVLFHRGHEHSGRLIDLVESLGLKNVAVFAWDARGHGKSPGERGFAASFGTLVRDADRFVRHVSETYRMPLEKMIVLGHSVGAVIVATWVHDYAPLIRALILATPALRIKLYVPLAIPGLRLMTKLNGGRTSFIKSYVKAKMLTHDPEQAQRYDADPLIARAIAVNILLGLHDAATRLMADAGAIRVPTLMMAGGADWVVKLSAEQKFF